MPGFTGRESTMRALRTLLLLAFLALPAAGAGAPDTSPVVEGGTIRLRAGQYAALRWDPARMAFTGVRLPPPPPALPPEAAAAVARVPEWLRDAVAEQFARLMLVPAEGAGSNGTLDADADGDGLADVVRAREDGVRVFARNRGTPGAPCVLRFSHEVKRAFPHAFGLCSRPFLFDGELHVLNVDGLIVRLPADGGPPQPALFEQPPIRAEDTPAATGDIDGDGDEDRIEGAEDGTLRLYLGPDGAEAKDAFAGFDAGEFSAPALRRTERGLELIVGRLEGDLLLYDLAFSGDRFRLTERESWDFTPGEGAKDLAEHYAKAYFPEEEEVLAPLDGKAVAAVAAVLAATPDDLLDEVAFSFANTPVEVVRVMTRLGQADLLLDNARAVAEMAARTAYARLVGKGDRTTIAYARAPGEWVEAPAEVYYHFVVHPRLLFEIPCRIDASWWDVRAAERGLSDSEWWAHEPERDIHEATSRGVFWRRGLVTDARFGRTLSDSVVAAPTLRDAAIAVHRFLAKGSEGGVGLMRFGYETQDLQPWLIYAKYYGSCGEHSIIAAACARTMLVPMSIVACRGEDHQWNEFWDTDGAWHHFDCCGAGNFDQPWGSSEGRQHEAKNVSTVTRWRGDDVLSATTTTVHNPPDAGYTTLGRGYTDVAEVTVRVVDAAGRPVDGALVVVKSHWENRDLVTIWGYTGGSGEVAFDLGYEPNGGYTIEALTPFGAAGVRNFPVVEGVAATLTLTAPGGPPPGLAPEPTAVGEGEPDAALSAEIVRAEIRPPNLVTGRRYRIGTWLADTHGYRGTKAGPVEVDPGTLLTALVLSPEEFANYEAGRPFRAERRAAVARDGRLGFPAWRDREHYVVLDHRAALFTEAVVKFTADGSRIPDGSAPRLVVDGDRSVSRTERGGRRRLTGKVTDDRRVASLTLDFPGWPAPRDVTDRVDPATGLFEVEIDTGEGGPLPAGEYVATLAARDAHGNETSQEILVWLTPARVFADQTIRQDDKDDPLRRCSWVYGPFDVAEGERFLIVRTKSAAEGFDMDLHLYRDLNGNGRPDGVEERVAQSAGPTANERVLLLRPPAGTYWAYCQGFTVPDGTAPLTVEVYPEGTPRAVVDVSPAGPVVARPAEFTFRLSRWVGGEDIRATLDGAAVELREKEGGTKVVPLPPDLAPDAPHEVVVTAGGRAHPYRFVVDTRPPSLAVLAPAPGAEAAGKVRVAARAADEAGPVRVVVRGPDGKEAALAPVKDAPGEYAADLDGAAWAKGDVFLVVIARDAAGHATEAAVRVTVK